MGRAAIGLIKKLIMLGVLAAVASAFGAYQYFTQWLHSPLAISTEALIYDLPRGGNLSSVAAELAEQQVLEHPRMLLYYARVTGQSAVRAGEYEISQGTTPEQLLRLLHLGDVVEYTITLIEGWTFSQVVEALAEAPRIQSLLQGPHGYLSFL